MDIDPRLNDHKGRVAITHYANQPQQCLICENTSRRLQPGGGPSRGPLHDYESSFQALVQCNHCINAALCSRQVSSLAPVLCGVASSSAAVGGRRAAAGLQRAHCRSTVTAPRLRLLHSRGGVMMPCAKCKFFSQGIRVAPSTEARVSRYPPGEN